MSRKYFRKLLTALLCLCLTASFLCACGAAPEETGSEVTEDAKTKPVSENAAANGAPLSADEAYEAAMSASEDEECTDEECVVVLYDDDGECPYNVLSPVADVAAG